MSGNLTPEIIQSFESPIEQALEGYTDLSDGFINFNIDKAVDFSMTPEKRYSAKSESPIYLDEGGQLRKADASLVLVAFMPSDDTGGHNAVHLEGVGDSEPRLVNGLPRSKDGVYGEAHLTIASFKPDQHIEPRVFTGNLGVLTHVPRHPQFCEIGFSVGQDRGEFVAKMNGDNRPSEPKASLTVGQDRSGERFGDPHAILNIWKIIQVAGFIAVKEDESRIL